jgi:Spy/CpxP family protein refolding chaperone
MRHFLILTVLSCVLTSSLVAQQRDTIRIQKEKPDMRPIKNLDLSAEQSRQLKKINQQSKATSDSLRNDTSIDAGMRRELQKQLIANRRKLIMETLTPEQQKQYKEALKANGKARRKNKNIAGEVKTSIKK